MRLDEFTESLNKDLNKQLVSSKVLLQSFRLIDETSRKSAAYADPRYAPFYYHLGKYVTPVNLLCVGFRLGLLPGCFLKSCESVENVLAIERSQGTYYSPRLATKNIRQRFKGNFRFAMTDIHEPSIQTPFDEHLWDLVIVDEEFDYDVGRIVFDKLWNNLSDGGIIVVDYLNGEKPNSDAFRDFAKIHNREPVEFKTRYRTGIVEK